MAVALVSVGACDHPKAAQDAKRKGQGPNVLLITLDTTRADHLGCYGYTEGHTPALDALADSGVRFEQAFCQVPLTLPSHASLLSGTYPPTNGVHINGASVLSDEVPTLAETFQAHGYRTGAFLGAWVLNSAFGLNRGFDHYDDDVSGKGAPSSLYQERPADEVCAAALAWLDQQPQAAFFAWVHFFDPHHPYAPPTPFREKLAHPYDGEIAFVDSQVRRLVDWLEASQCRQRTLIVIVGDHGEAFGEHGEIDHGLFLYHTTMHVPFIVSFPPHWGQGKVVSASVRLVDVAPTILDLMGWEQTVGVQGESLRPAVETDSFAFLPAYGESNYPLVAFGWASLRSYTTRQWKYVEAPGPELYDRRADPGERTNVIAQHPDIASRLQGELNGLVASMAKRDGESVALDPEAIRALESLGYVGITQAPVQPASGRPRQDPKDMIAVFRGMMTAKRLAKQHRHAEVVKLLKPLVARSPESDELHAVLGEAYLQLGRLKEAEQAYRASLRTFPANPYKLCRLGDALHGQNRVAEAMECYRRALSACANYDVAHNKLGAAYFQMKRFPEACEHFRRDLEFNPTSPNAMTNLASAVLHMGQHRKAMTLLQEALQHDPGFAPAHRLLWQVLLLAGKRVEAINALRAACKALPDDRLLTRHLAGLLATTPQAGRAAAQEAVVLARECCEADPNVPENFDVLAIAYAGTGDFANAIDAARHALFLAENQGRSELAGQIAARLQAYQRGRTH